MALYVTYRIYVDSVPCAPYLRTYTYEREMHKEILVLKVLWTRSPGARVYEADVISQLSTFLWLWLWVWVWLYHCSCHANGSKFEPSSTVQLLKIRSCLKPGNDCIELYVSCIVST